MARDFHWYDKLWAVIKEDGSFAGVPCTSYEEASDLANQHENSHVYNLCVDYDYEAERYPEKYCYDEDEPYDIDDDCGFDAYMGEYTYDC